jgi:hypothetical protein
MAAGPIDVESRKPRKMMSAGSDEPTLPDDAPADGRRTVTPPDLIRDLILGTTALALLAAWSVSNSLKHPEQGLVHLLWAVVCVLLAIQPWVSRPIGGRLASEPNGSFRRTLVALSPLFMLGLIAFGYVIDSRQQAAEKALAQREEAWKQSVELQREAVERASKQISDASRKGEEAAKALSKTAVQVRRPDGKHEHRFDPTAFRKWKEAIDEMGGAFKRHSAELDRLTRLQLEEPGRYGRP